MIRLKSPDEISLLRQGGKILASVLRQVVAETKAGKTTAELDALAERLILEAGGEPSFKGYGGPKNPFPATLCTSVNSELVHGIPNDYILRDGDIVSLDVGMRYPKKTGLYTDMATTVIIGKVSPAVEKLVKVTKKALQLWIKLIKPGEQLNYIGGKVQDYIENEGFGVVRDLVGHGVGHEVHEDPPIPNYFTNGLKVELKEGMVLALEPMVSLGDYRIRTLNDEWTVVMRDNSLCSHEEHTIVVTKRGCEVLTE
ncbi:MAG: Methionine aminopeptidase [Parcubacteria group bacterium GW2011_GWC2_39_14]|nr:MAG: Methionine aminopeptidase [Parcubacteria group bacterium GW2011_GWC2_39_14]KKR55490.1 MAG: Methionine aminopeptidase [Parcubacteria group bacterium GW2011_GWA2_40_23]